MEGAKLNKAEFSKSRDEMLFSDSSQQEDVELLRGGKRQAIETCSKACTVQRGCHTFLIAQQNQYGM